MTRAAGPAPPVAGPVDVLLATSFFMALDPKQAEKGRPFPPLATLYAASVLRQAGWRVALYDAMLEADESSFASVLERHQPRLVALFEDNFNFLTKMCLGRMRQAALNLVRVARERQLPVVVAGSDATDHPARYLGAGADLVLVGEGEWTLAEVVARWLGAAGEHTGSIDGMDESSVAVDSGAGGAMPAATIHAGDLDWSEVPGLAWLGAEGILRRSPSRLPERDADRFPPPAWDLVDMDAYRARWQRRHGEFVLNLATTRGCPYHCNWCAKPIWGQRYAMRSPEAVADELALVKARFKPDRVWFADDIFGLRPDWTAAFGQAVARRKAQIPYQIQSRVDLISDAAADGLAQSGCVEVWLGVESGSQAVLDAMEKGIRLEDVPAALERLRSRGIRVCFFIQLGYPGEGWPEVLATRDLIRRLRPDDIGISVSYPLPGTRFFDRVAADLGPADHWVDSQDLAMLFRGTFSTATYRALHELLHRDLALHRQWAEPPDLVDEAPNGPGASASAARESPAERSRREALAALALEWQALEASAYE